MKASEEAYRLYSCGRCAEQVRICRDCDRGNRYCAGECAMVRRRESLRRAAKRFQESYRGACRHAARQHAWRKRHAQKVTHQGSLASAISVTVANTTTQSTPHGAHADTASVELQPHATAHEFAAAPVHAHWHTHHTVPPTPRCCFCGRMLSRFARLGRLRGGP